MVVLAVGLAVYALDCGGMTTPQQAMQCCNSMQCSRHGQTGMDCCKTMPKMHRPFVQLSSAHGMSLSPVVLSVMSASVDQGDLGFSARSFPAQCHAPPVFGAALPLPLRI